MAYQYQDPIANAVDSFTRLRSMQIAEKNSEIERRNATSAQVIARATNRREQESHDLKHKQDVQAYEDAEFRKAAKPVAAYMEAYRNGASKEELNRMAPAAFDALNDNPLLRPLVEKMMVGRDIKDPRNTRAMPVIDPKTGAMVVSLKSPTGTGVITENGTNAPDDPVMMFSHDDFVGLFDSVYAGHNGGDGYFAQLDAEKRAFTEFGKATDDMSYQSDVTVSSVGGGSAAMATPGQSAVANTTSTATGANPPPVSPAAKRLAQLDDDLAQLRAAKDGAAPAGETPSDIAPLNMDSVRTSLAGRRMLASEDVPGVKVVSRDAPPRMVGGYRVTGPDTRVEPYAAHNTVPATAPDAAHFGAVAATQAPVEEAAPAAAPAPDTSTYDQKIAKAEAERNELLASLPAEQRQGSGATAALSQHVEQSMTPGQRQLVIRIANGQVDPKRVSPERRAQVAQLMVKAGKWEPIAAANFIQSGSPVLDVYGGHEANGKATVQASTSAAHQANATANLEAARWVAPQAQAAIAADYARVTAANAQAKAAGSVDPYEATERRIKFEESLVTRIVESTGMGKNDQPRAKQMSRALLDAIEDESGGSPEMMRRMASDAYVIAPMMARMEQAADGDIGSIDGFARTAIRAVYRDGDKAGIFGPDGQIDGDKLEAYLLGIANGK